MDHQFGKKSAETLEWDTSSPVKLLELGLGFWNSKALLSAVELDVFTHLGDGARDAAELTERLGLHPRSAVDFLDALVALQVLEREDGLYRNTYDTGLFLDSTKPGYIGGVLQMANSRLYPFWGSLTEALRSGLPQNEAKQGLDPFESIYQNERVLRAFLKSMTGFSLGAAKVIARKFPWHDYGSVMDIGTAQGALVVEVASTHSHLTAGGFDLPAVRPVFDEYVAQHGLQDRVRFHPGNFLSSGCPSADVLVMGHILHDWDLAQKRELIAKCYEALPSGGCLIIYDAIIDDEHRKNAFGLLMSINMLIETPGGFDYTAAQCRAWMAEVGFKEIRVEPLLGPDSMIIGIR